MKARHKRKTLIDNCRSLRYSLFNHWFVSHRALEHTFFVYWTASKNWSKHVWKSERKNICKSHVFLSIHLFHSNKSINGNKNYNKGTKGRTIFVKFFSSSCFSFLCCGNLYWTIRRENSDPSEIDSSSKFTM